MTFIKSALEKWFIAYRRDTSGQFAIWIGLAALPLLSAVSFAVDYNRAERVRLDVKGALDSAALATVTNQSLSSHGRAEYAKAYFNENFSNANLFDLTVDVATAERVALTARGSSDVTVGRAIGLKAIDISETSVATLTKNDVICVLTLDPDGAGAFSVTDGSTFEASECAVQVNSSNILAAVVGPLSKASAQSFCIVGGAIGNFFPYVNTECSAVTDPYENMPPVVPAPCINDSKLSFKVEKKIDLSIYGNLIVDETIAIVGNDLTLAPGTYCDSLRVEGYNVKFLPGVYVMNNAPIEFKKGASATADGVVFVMYGNDSRIKIESGSSLNLKAPVDGAFAGMAIYQNADSALIDRNGKRIKEGTGLAQFPTATSELKGGSSMSVLGTVYLPTQELKVGSNSGMGTHSPATSYIGYRVAFEGGSDISVSVDNEGNGLPDLMRQSDDSARLVQ